MRTKIVRDSFSTALRSRIRELRREFTANYKASFKDVDSNSYDRSHDLGGALLEAIQILDQYVKFKTLERKIK